MTASKPEDKETPSSLQKKSSIENGGAHQTQRQTVGLSPAVSAFQFRPTHLGADVHHVSSSDSASAPTPDPKRIQSNATSPVLPTLVKDGYIYKDEVIILDKEKKEQLLRVGEISLQSEWTFWYDRYVPNLPASEYEANLQVISTVGSVQKFWSVYNNIDGPEKLGFRSNLHFMRKNIKPTWEDPKNEYGGSFYFKIPKAHSPLAWRDLLVLLIGEKVEGCLEDTVCGVSVSSRQQFDSFQIWTSQSHHSDSAQEAIRSWLIEQLRPAEIQSFYFKVHRNHAAFQKQPRRTNDSTTSLLKNGLSPTVPFEMRRKITEESIEKVVADIERLGLRQKRSNSSKTQGDKQQPQ